MADTRGRSTGPRSAQPSRRLAAIMFTDLVGYSALAHRNEDLAIELLELHRSWVREILPLHGGIEIETVGDAFLIEFAGALAAVECAVAIQRRFAEHNAGAPADRRMELRVGVHLGDIEHKGSKIFGDGVNIASRIHGMARPGGICVSEVVHSAVRNRPAFQFASLGSPPLKNITTALELFEVSSSLNLAPPAVREGAPKPAPARRWRAAGVAAVAGAGVVIALAAIAGWFATREPARGAPAIAVLPFENLSADPDSAFFTDGLHDTVIGHLSRVAGLKVISRTSVMRYRGQHPDLRQVARELGVVSVLEGSVQRAGTKMRVVAQLIDADSDTHLWSSEYDRDVTDVFAVQADIARQVASAVQVKLTPQETASIQAVPTHDPEAYDLYLKALPVFEIGALETTKLLQAIEWLDQALERDPRFALAYVLRAWVHDTLDWWGFDRSAARRELAKRDAEMALSLAPGLSEAHVAMALQLYHGVLDYHGAIRELEIARALAPGSSQPGFWLGVIYRRLDRWDESLVNLERVSILDPLNASAIVNYGNTLQAMRRLEEARKAYDRVAALDPSTATRVDPAYTRFLLSGDAAALVRTLDGLPKEGETGCWISATQAGVLDGLGRHDESIALLKGCPLSSFVMPYYNERVPRDHFVALAKWHKDRGRVPPEAAGARAMMEKMLAATPDRSHLRMFLAMNLVMSGERERALAEVERALKDTPRSRDAWAATDLLSLAAAVHANTEHLDRAFAELEESLSRPGGLFPAEIRASAAYAPLRSDPRYEKLLAGKPLKGGA